MASIVQVPTTFGTNGGALGYIGATGIELSQAVWTSLYDGVVKGQYDQAVFYELGRNFWFYGSQLEAVDPFVTGFAIVNRFVAMEVANLPGGPFNGLEFGEFKTSILEDLAQTFLSGSTYNLANTIGDAKGVASARGWGASDLAASLLYQVYEDFGITAYRAFYAQLATLPQATTKDQAFANFILAANRATGIDYSFLNKAAGVAYVTGSRTADVLNARADGSPVFGFGGNDELRGTDARDMLFGDGGADALVGAGGADTLIGGSGSDTITGGLGDDRIDGGAGIDTALWSGLFRQYGVTGNSTTGSAVSGPDGRDTVTGVERFKFADGSLIVDAENSGAQVIRLYDAVLQRAPDNNGIDFYVDFLEDRGGTLLGVANDMIGSGEFQAATGALSNAQFVDYVYQHTLGRAPDAGGKAYYTQQLDGGLSRGAMLISFSESAEHRTLTAGRIAQGYFNTDDSYQSVALLYDGAFNRLPDAGGLTYYAEKVKAGSLTLQQVTADFAGSTEFRNAIAGKDNGQIVDFIFQNTLDRAPDAGGRAFYTNQLNQGATAAGVLQDVALSPEHYNLFASHITYGIDVL